MKKRPAHILALASIVTTAATGFAVPQALASPVEKTAEVAPENPAPEEDKGVSVDTAARESSVDTAVNKDELPTYTSTSKGADSFVAHIYVTTADNTETIVVKDPKATVSDEIADNGFTAENLRTATGDKVDIANTLNNGDTLVLFDSHSQAESKEVEIKPITEFVNDDELPEGEINVVEEGETGKGVETVVEKKSLALDDTKNTRAQEAAQRAEELVEKDNKLTIIQAPKKRVVHVGRKVVEDAAEALARTEVFGSSGTPVASSMGSVGNGVFKNHTSSEISQLQASTQNAAVKLALAQAGKPYVWGAVGPDSFDCSGLIYWVYKTNLGKNIPRVAGDQGAASMPVSWDDAQPGDILWKNNEHIGMYIGNGQMIHASTPSTGVIVQDASWARAEGYRVGRFA